MQEPLEHVKVGLRGPNGRRNALCLLQLLAIISLRSAGLFYLGRMRPFPCWGGGRGPRGRGFVGSYPREGTGAAGRWGRRLGTSKPASTGGWDSERGLPTRHGHRRPPLSSRAGFVHGRLHGSPARSPHLRQRHPQAQPLRRRGAAEKAHAGHQRQEEGLTPAVPPARTSLHSQPTRSPPVPHFELSITVAHPSLTQSQRVTAQEDAVPSFQPACRGPYPPRAHLLPPPHPPLTSKGQHRSPATDSRAKPFSQHGEEGLQELLRAAVARREAKASSKTRLHQKATPNSFYQQHPRSRDPHQSPRAAQTISRASTFTHNPTLAGSWGLSSPGMLSPFQMAALVPSWAPQASLGSSSFAELLKLH